MSPVESMACGTPVIAVNDGWLKESIIDGKTGLLIPPNCKPVDISEAVKKIETMSELSIACIQRAADFSLDKFEIQLRDFLSKN
jgi:glycosyltransferase involved in cell wall biosynthesis